VVVLPTPDHAVTKVIRGSGHSRAISPHRVRESSLAALCAVRMLALLAPPLADRLSSLSSLSWHGTHFSQGESSREPCSLPP
jgi:hypothetical protein